MNYVQNANSGQNTAQRANRKKRLGLIVVITALIVLAGCAVLLIQSVLSRREERVGEKVFTHCYDAYYDGYDEETVTGEPLNMKILRLEDASLSDVDMNYFVNRDIPEKVRTEEFEDEYDDLCCVEIAVRMNERSDYKAYFLFGCDIDAKDENPVPLCLSMIDAEGHYINYFANKPKDVITVLYGWISYLEFYYEMMERYGVEPPDHDGLFVSFSAHTFLEELIDQRKPAQTQQTDEPEELNVQTAPSNQVPGLDLEENPAFKPGGSLGSSGVIDAYMETCGYENGTTWSRIGTIADIFGLNYNNGDGYEEFNVYRVDHPGARAYYLIPVNHYMGMEAPDVFKYNGADVMPLHVFHGVY